MLNIRYDLPVEIEHIVQCDGVLLPESLLTLAQPNFCRHDVSVEPYVFRGVITIPMLRRIIFEVGNYEFIFRQISGVLEK